MYVIQAVKGLICDINFVTYTDIPYNTIQTTLGLLISKHLGKSEGGSFNWYSYLEGRLADILPILGDGLLNGRGHLYGILWYIIDI